MSKGFSLIELVVATGISCISFLLVATIFTSFSTQVAVSMAKADAEESLMLAAYYARYFMSNAVALSVQDTRDLTSTNLACGQPTQRMQPGQIVMAPGLIASCYKSPVDASLATNKVDTISIFARETGPTVKTATTPSGSQFFWTGFFYQRAVDDPVRGVYNPGRIFFSPGATLPAPPTPPPGVMTPSLGDIWLDNVVYLQVETDPVVPTASEFGAARSAMITITTRYFMTGDKTRWRWCAPGSCSAPDSVDISSSVRVGFRDNVLKTSGLTGGTEPDRLFGKLYFYQMIMPNF